MRRSIKAHVTLVEHPDGSASLDFEQTKGSPSASGVRRHFTSAALFDPNTVRTLKAAFTILDATHHD